MRDRYLSPDAAALRAPAAAPTLRHPLLAPSAWPVSLLLALLVIAPSYHFLPSISNYNEQRLLQLGVLGATLLLVGAGGAAGRAWLDTLRLVPAAARGALGALAALGVAAALQAPLVAHALLETALLVALAVLTLAVAAARRVAGSRLDTVLVQVVLVAAALYLLTFIAAYLGDLHDGLPIIPREMFPGFDNLRFFNQLQTWLLPVVGAAALWWPGARGTTTAALRLVGAGWWALLVASECRGSALGLVVATGLVAAWGGRRARPFLREHLLTLLLGVGLYLLAFGTTDALRVAERFAQPDQPRLLLWRRALEMTAAHPWLGAGPMHFARYPLSIAAHPHNALLQALAEFGVPFTALAAGLLGWAGVAWLRRGRAVLAANEAGSLTRIALTASLAAAAVQAMVDGSLVTPVSQCAAALVVGWALGLSLPRELRARRAAGVGTRLLLAGGSVSVVALLAGGAQLAPWRTRDWVARAPQVRATGWCPRFWHQGIIDAPAPPPR